MNIESEGENQFIKTEFLSGGGGRYWIGLSDLGNEGDWRWTDGTEITGYEKWRSGQPNNHEGDQHCGAILKGIETTMVRITTQNGTTKSVP